MYPDVSNMQEKAREWKNTPKYPRHFEVEGSFVVVYDDENDFIVHTLALNNLFPMVEEWGGIILVVTKQCEKVVVANGLKKSEKDFLIETLEEAIDQCSRG